MECVIPLRWEHLTMGEQYVVLQELSDSFEPWEIIHGYYVREGDGLAYVEDLASH